MTLNAIGAELEGRQEQLQKELDALRADARAQEASWKGLDRRNVGAQGTKRRLRREGKGDGGREAYGVHLCCIAHKKKKQKKAILPPNPRLEAPLPPFFFANDVSQFRHNSTTLRSTFWCSRYNVGKATAVFVSSRHRDFVAEVGKCSSRSLDLFFLVLRPVSFF